MTVSADYAVSLLPSEFFDSPIFKEVLKIYIEEFEEIQQCINDIVAQKNVAVAEGVQLDGIGEHVAKLREGLSDIDYRKQLNIQKTLNACEGNYNTVIQVWKALVETDNVSLTEEYPAGVLLYSGGGAPSIEEITQFENALPVTVTASYVSSFEDVPPFVFEGGVGLGFGTTEDSSIGGGWVSRYVST